MSKKKSNDMPKRPPIPKGTFKRLLKTMAHYYRPQLIVVAICVFVCSISGVIATMFMQKLIDECIVPGVSLGYNAIKAKLFRYILIMGSIYVLGVIGAFINTRIMAGVTQGMLMHFRDDMFNKMQSLPIKYFDTNAHGDIMSTYTNDTDAVRELIGGSLPTLFQSALSFISIFVMMLRYSLWLTLVVILFLFIMFNVVKKVGGASSRFMVRQQQSLAVSEGYVEEMMKGMKVVKVFNHADNARARFNELNGQLFKDSETANKYGNILMPFLGNIGNIMYVALAVIGGLLVVFGATNVCLMGVSAITIGVIVSFLSMSRQMSQTVGQTSQQVAMIAMGLAGLSRCFALIDQPAEQDDGYVILVNAVIDANGNVTETAERTGRWAWKHYHRATDETTYTPLRGDIELDNVDFGYAEDKQVLYDVTLRALPGQKFAFVGATGAGKTTITNLINRFYDIQDGKIRFDGINVNKIKKDDLRRSLGIVLQDTNLFTGTVMENIRYGRMDATDEDCMQAAMLANAHDFISRLPDGYQTVLKNNGANLSQGQRQLLSIARAAVADPPAMILDEATSSIDTRTEALVQQGMDNLMRGRTVFVIAHRLSTVMNSDKIIVLDHGRIIEQGTHDELLSQQGVYYSLYTGAFELE